MSAKFSPVRAVAIAALLSAVVGVAVLLFFALRPPQYEARVGLVASPIGPADRSAQAFGPVVSLAIPATVDLVKSPSTLAAVRAQVPNAPADLAEMTTVGVVPGSGLVRIAVTAADEATAVNLARAFEQHVAAAELFGTVGELRSVGEPTVRQIAPDRALGLGYAAVAALASGLVGFALAWLYGVDSNRRVRRGLLSAGISRPIPIYQGIDTDTAERLSVLQGAAARPVRVIADAPPQLRAADELREYLALNQVPLANDYRADAAVVVVTRPRGDGQAVGAAAAAVNAPAVVIAVVVADHGQQTDSDAEQPGAGSAVDH